MTHSLKAKPEAARDRSPKSTQKNLDYYYDDAHGYEVYRPDTENDPGEPNCEEHGTARPPEADSAARVKEDNFLDNI